MRLNLKTSALFLFLLVIIPGCQKGNQLVVSVESPDPVSETAGALDNGKFLLTIEKGDIPAGGVFTVRLPGILYPDMNKNIPGVFVRAKGEELTAVTKSFDDKYSCPSPSRSQYDLHFAISTKLSRGDGIEVAIENYLTPFRSTKKLPIFFFVRNSINDEMIEVGVAYGHSRPDTGVAVFLDAPTVVFEGEPITLKVAGVDKYGNSALFFGDGIIIEINDQRPDLPKVDLSKKAFATIQIPPQDLGVYRFYAISESKVIGKSGPCLVVKKDFTEKYFWGDPHSHTGFSDAFTTVGPDVSFRYAKDVAHLDFAAITDHPEPIWGCPLTELEIKILKAQAGINNAPGRFITFFGFEWTGAFIWDKNWPVNQGHAYILYPDKGPFCRADKDDCDSFEKLIKTVSPFNPIVVRHHVCTSWAPTIFSGKAFKEMAVVEITFSHGACECYDCPGVAFDKVTENESYIRGALLTGNKFGIVGGSDNHHARPGARRFSKKTDQILDAGGLTCVISKELSREGILDGIRKRKCYATTSARIYLDFTVGDKPMGSIAPKSSTVKGAITVHGASVIDEIVVFRGDLDQRSFSEVFSAKPGKEDFSAKWEDPAPVKRGVYYLRVLQKDFQMAWSSPIWVE